jgi:hypothetical protein
VELLRTFYFKQTARLVLHRPLEKEHNVYRILGFITRKVLQGENIDSTQHGLHVNNIYNTVGLFDCCAAGTRERGSRLCGGALQPEQLLNILAVVI